MLAAAACRPPETAIDLQLDCAPATVFTQVTVRVRAPALGIDATRRFDGDGGVRLPSSLYVPFEARGAEVVVDVTATAPSQTRRGTGTTTTRVGQVVPLAVDLSIPFECRDGKVTGDEVAVDCGGTRCPPCGLGTTCRSPQDCDTGACAPQGFCTYASGPPAWRSVAPLVPARVAFAGTSTPQGVVASGGRAETGEALSVVQRLDANGAWSALTPFPGVRSDHALAFFDGKLWALGGEQDPTHADTLAASASGWVAEKPMNRIRTALSASVTSGRLWVTGGLSGTSPTPTLESLAPGGSWMDGRSMPTARSQLALVTMPGGTLYAVGGFGSGGNALATVEQFSPEANTWSQVTPMPTARGALAAVAAPDGRLWVLGGKSGGALDSVEAYFPPPIDRWVTLPFLPGQRESHAAALAPDGRLLVFGGRGNTPNLTRVDAYGPVLTLSSSTAPKGGSFSVSGENFAANATIGFVLSPGGAVLGTTATDAAGVATTFQATLPTSVAPGAYRVVAEDDRSHYPVSQPLAVEP